MRLGKILVKTFILALLLLILFVAAINFRLIKLPPALDPFGAPDLRETSSWIQSLQLKNLDFDPQICLQSIKQAGIASSLLPNIQHSAQCYLDETLMLDHMSAVQIRPEQTRCNIAARLYLWQKNVVQPSAQKYFGKGVKEITHFGSYNCRTIRHSRNMSEHATANAFDISGFRMIDGRLIGVLARFNAGGPEGKFLHEVRDGLCDYFNRTLSPDYNTDHADHFHVDMGWVRGCR